MKRRTPSATALSIAGNFATAAADPALRPLLSDPETPYWRRFVLAHSLGARWKLFLWSFPPTRRFLWNLSESVLPGGALHILLRKRVVEETVRSALEGGATQAVSFGAGFDPLFLRLAPHFPGVRFYELDHPDTQSVKRRALEAEGVPERVELLSVDFRREVAGERLRACPEYDPAARTVFIAEGVLMYLSPPEVAELMETVYAGGGSESTFLFTVVEKEVLERPDSTLARMAGSLERLGEPLRSSLSRKELDSFLRRYGFRRRLLLDRTDLKKKYLDPLGMQRTLIEGELLVVARSAAR